MKLLGFIGAKGSGKDTVFQLLQAMAGNEDVDVRRFAFADPLKLEVLDAVNQAGWIGTLEDLERLKGRFRLMLQWWGTEFRRELFGQDYWLRKMDDQLVAADVRRRGASPEGLAVITDVRFENEGKYVRERGGQIVSVVRGASVIETDPHASETNRWNITPDHYILNHGTLDDLADAVSKFWETLQRQDWAIPPGSAKSFATAMAGSPAKHDQP